MHTAYDYIVLKWENSECMSVCLCVFFCERFSFMQFRMFWLSSSRAAVEDPGERLIECNPIIFLFFFVFLVGVQLKKKVRKKMWAEK